MSTMPTNDNMDVIAVDQLVFTSVRSPMGEGYRVVAASPGVRTEEKSEITRRAPSHGSLTSTAADAIGMLTYPMATGRYAVAYSCHAGKEHTARGGERVYTHFALLDSDAYARFYFNPTSVHSAIRQAIGQERVLKELSTLPKLELSTRSGRPARVEQVCGAFEQVVAAAFKAKPAVISHHGGSFEAVIQVMGALPAAVRRELAISCGVKYAPSRQTLLCFVERDQGETQRALRGMPVVLVDADRAGAPVPARPGGTSGLESWISFARKCLTSDRVVDLAWMCARLDSEVTAERLARLAALHADTELLATANEATLDRLSARWMSLDAHYDPELTMIRGFVRAAQDRSNQLKAEAPGLQTAGSGRGA
ncbi:MAG: hypothetical protein KF841_12980 [Phycisphaerae bacterium]|nr:hypothetical protein [Phycisphaerae bacterium]